MCVCPNSPYLLRTPVTGSGPILSKNDLTFISSICKQPIFKHSQVLGEHNFGDGVGGGEIIPPHTHSHPTTIANSQRDREVDTKESDTVHTEIKVNYQNQKWQKIKKC